jgi:hypothetical protein
MTSHAAIREEGSGFPATQGSEFVVWAAWPVRLTRHESSSGGSVSTDHPAGAPLVKVLR